MFLVMLVNIKLQTYVWMVVPAGMHFTQPQCIRQQSHTDKRAGRHTDSHTDRPTHTLTDGHNHQYICMCRLTHLACVLQEEEQCRLHLCPRKAWPSASRAPQAWLSTLRTSLMSSSLEITRSVYPSTLRRCVPACACTGIGCKLCHCTPLSCSGFSCQG